MKREDLEKIGFGGGCHWCTEAVFQAIKGVELVDQGFISSHEPHDDFSEAVIVHFDPVVISLSKLLEIHLYTHSSTSAHTMRPKYRSAVYTFSTTQEQKVFNDLEALQKRFSDQILTMILPFVSFKPSAAQFQNYYDQDPGKPFCTTYIIPKLKFLEDQYPEDLKT